MNNVEPKKGAIAKCGWGTIGVIASDGPVEVTYPDGNKGIAWTGFHLQEHHLENGHVIKIGDPWSSKKPLVIFFLEGGALNG